MSVKITYISAACNHTPGVVDWGKNNLICYGASNSVLIYDIEAGGGIITHTLSKHTDSVNAVKWISGTDCEHELVSVSADKTAIVWTLHDDKYHPYVLDGHEDIVDCVDAVYKDPSEQHAVIVTGSADSKIKIWEKISGVVCLKQTIDLGYNIAITLKISSIPLSDNLIIAYGTNQSKIHFYIEKENCFEPGPSLGGHENWVTGLDFCDYENKFMLASASQDHFVRIWKFIPADSNSFNLDVIEVNNKKYCIVLDSILTGHDGWVYSVSWCAGKLLSASLDKSIIIWEYNDDASMWLESDRVGEIGGNSLGFYGGLFSKDGRHILGHGYHGAFHIWKFDENFYSWQPKVTIGGHFKEVTDICWDPFGYYLMSVSADQTTRIHAPWNRSGSKLKTWHEIARPQVHGFDINCLAIVNHYGFVSGAEEKIIRTFQAPQTFVDNFHRICDLKELDINYTAPRGASIPSLGLSNKAIYQNDNSAQALNKSKKDMYPEESHFTAITLTEPPTEENLMQNTLWPEIQKLYGHGYELYALAASPDGKFIASSCKATTPEYAAVIIWETAGWQIVQKLISHTLTIAQLAFSPDSQHILSVSRDRRWSLFTKDETTGIFSLTATTSKDKKLAVHTRIIWCCAWTHDSRFFATGSRDGKVAVWSILADAAPTSNVLELPKESITALAFANEMIGDYYILAIGLENGSIHLYKWNAAEFVKIFTLDEKIAHSLCVRRLSFRPKQQVSNESDILQLASCSNDHSVRIYTLDKSI